MFLLVKNSCIKYRKIIFVIILLSIILPDVIAYFYQPERAKDFHRYVQAGSDAIGLKDLYRHSAPGYNNTWPPFFSFLMVPISIMDSSFGRPVAKVIWYFVNLFSLIISIQLVNLVLLNVKPKFLSDHHLDFSSPNVFLPILFILPGIINNFLNLQINPLILLFIISGFYFYKKDRSLLSGLFFGLSISIKAFPILFLIYFIIRKQWKLSLWIILFCIFFTSFPIFFYGPDMFTRLFQRWVSISFFEKYIIGCNKFSNQSFYAFWSYILACHLKLTDHGSFLIHLFTKVSGLILFISAMVIFARNKYDKYSLSAVLEFSIISGIMILISPIAWRHYWVFFYPGSAFVFLFFKTHKNLYNKTAMKFLMIGWIVLLLSPWLLNFSFITIILKSYGSFTISGVLLTILLLKVHLFLGSSVQFQNINILTDTN